MPNKITPARPQDIPELAELEKLCPHAAGWGVAGLASELDKKNALVLRIKNGAELAGFICAEFIPPESQLLNIAVRPSLGRRGFGAALFTALLDAAEQRGCNSVSLEVNEHNLPARAFYKKLGFKIVGRRTKFYNGCQDALLLDYALASPKGASHL